MEAKETLTAMIILLPLLMVSLCSPVSARPRLRSVRSADSNPTQHRLHRRNTQSMFIASGMFRDLMFRNGDANGDGKLSPEEISYFYLTVLGYNPYVASNYGNLFLAADFDLDGLLDPDELLVMIMTMEATDWSRR